MLAGGRGHGGEELRAGFIGPTNGPALLLLVPAKTMPAEELALWT